MEAVLIGCEDEDAGQPKLKMDPKRRKSLAAAAELAHSHVSFIAQDASPLQQVLATCSDVTLASRGSMDGLKPPRITDSSTQDRVPKPIPEKVSANMHACMHLLTRMMQPCTMLPCSLPCTMQPCTYARGQVRVGQHACRTPRTCMQTAYIYEYTYKTAYMRDCAASMWLPALPVAQ